MQRRIGRRSPINLPTSSAETINDKASSKAHDIKREPNYLVTPFAKPLSRDEPTQSTSQAVAVHDVEPELPRYVKEKSTSKSSTAKGQPSVIFRTLSGSRKTSKHANSARSTDAPFTHGTARRVRNFSSISCSESN